jgi:hypothetical protein
MRQAAEDGIHIIKTDVANFDQVWDIGGASQVGVHL